MLSAVKLLEAHNVYTTAMNVAMKVFELTQHVPHEDPRRIGQEMIHYSSSVCRNMLDAWQNRTNQPVFMDKLNSASLDAAETRERIKTAVESQFIKPELGLAVTRSYDELIDKIAGMLKQPGEFT
jgi:four helix bundle protein